MKSGLLSPYFHLMLLALSIILPGLVHGATPSSTLVDVIPESPAPGENVRIELNSYLNDLDSVPISWSVNGQVVSSGIGEKTLTLAAPQAGQETRVLAAISLPEGAINRIIIVRPTVMTLLWQASNSYVPPFYKGKALPPMESEIKIVAMPEIRNGQQIVNPKNLVYSWKKNYTNDPGASGYGKNFYTFTSDYLERSNDVGVSVSTTDQQFTSQASVTVRSYEPKLLFYRNHSSLGTIWEQSLYNGYKIVDSETIEAAPYFISPRDLRMPSLVWGWSINDNFIGAPNIKKNTLTLVAQPGVSGSSEVELVINNRFKLLGDVKGGIMVEF